MSEPSEQHQNGAGHEDPFVAELRERVTRLTAHADELHMAWSQANAEAKRYEKALQYMTGDLAQQGRLKKETTKTRPTKPHGTGISEERIARIKDVVIQLAHDREEFRQVDVRAVTQFSSTIMTAAFETLRQENFIRMARAEGNNKWYRLTREGLRETARA